MDRSTRLTLLTVVLAAAVIFPQTAEIARAHPLRVVLAVLVLIVLAMVNTTAFGWRLRSVRPDQFIEKAYLSAISARLGRTPALLSQQSSREFDLDAVFTPLTLRPRDPAHMPPAPPTGGIGRQLGEREAENLGTPTRGEWWTLWLLTLGVFGALALLAVQQIGPLFWPFGRWRPTIGGFIGGIGWVTLVVFVGGAYWQIVRPALRRTWRLQRICLAEPGTPEAAIWHQRRLLIFGGPGSGKTSLLRYLALLCARERLGVRQAFTVRDRLGWPETPFPIFIPLRALTATTGTLLERYAAALSPDGGELLGPSACSCDAAFLKARAERGGCLFLIDSFDELRDTAARRQIATLVRELPVGPVDHPNWVLVSTRPVGYEGQLDASTFSLQDLAPLDSAQMTALVKARYSAIASSDVRLTDPQRRAERLIERIPSHSGLRRLSENPMLLSLVVALHYEQRGRDLPDERYLLFERACRHLVVEWERARADDARPATASAASDDLKNDQKLRLLRELAWAMYERRGAVDGSHTVIVSDAAERVLAGTLETMLVSAGRDTAAFKTHCAAEAKLWLADLEQTGGLLRERGNVAHTGQWQIQFAHQAFQEYLAAWAACSSDLGDDDRAARHERLLERWHEPRLHEVLVLYAALSDATPVVTHLLTQTGPLALHLAGEVLLEHPPKLDNAVRDTAMAALRRAALDTPDPSTEDALAALAQLRDLNLLPNERQLLAVYHRASDKLVLLECLGEMGRNEPSNRVAAPALRAAMETLLASETAPPLRIAAANILARSESAAELPLPELVFVPGGRYVVGAAASDTQAFDRERPQRTVQLDPFWIGRTPLTNAEYRAFVADKGYTTKSYWSAAGWRWVRAGLELFPVGTGLSDPISWLTIFTGGRLDWIIARWRRTTPFTQPWARTWDDPRWNGDRQPVVGICRYEAEAYCHWLNARTGGDWYLPSETEWEAAARGADERTYPWEGEWEEGRCNSREAGIGKPTPVGSYPGGASPCGAQDMAGNVWEWTASRMPRTQRKSYRQLTTVALFIVLGGSTVLRGGSYYTEHRFVRAPYRYFNYARDRFFLNGVRVASRTPARPPDS